MVELAYRATLLCRLANLWSTVTTAEEVELPMKFEVAAWRHKRWCGALIMWVMVNTCARLLSRLDVVLRLVNDMCCLLSAPTVVTLLCFFFLHGGVITVLAHVANLVDLHEKAYIRLFYRANIAFSMPLPPWRGRHGVYISPLSSCWHRGLPVWSPQR
jgi:hypothetical protein